MPNYDETLVLIDELANLPDGWRYGQGVAIKPVFVARIKKLVKMFELAGLERFNVFAEVDGGFILRTYFQEYFFEIAVSPIEGMDVSIENKNDVLALEEDTTPEKIVELFKRFLEICLLSEPSTRETMTAKLRSLSRPYSNEGQMEVFQPLTSNAPYRPALQSGLISRGFTSSSLATRPSITQSHNGSRMPSNWEMSLAHLAISATATSSGGQRAKRRNS